MPLSLSRTLAVTLALLVPIQGAAAVAAGVCMTLGHHQSEGASQAKHGAQEHEHAHEGASHSHSGDAGLDQKDESRASSCGPCVACCASASIAMASLLTIIPWAPQAPYVSSQLDPSGVQLDGRDRPPLAL